MNPEMTMQFLSQLYSLFFSVLIQGSFIISIAIRWGDAVQMSY